MMIRSSRRGRARETARGSADGLTGLLSLRTAASSDWAGLVWCWGRCVGPSNLLGGRPANSRAASGAQLDLFLLVVVVEVGTCDVCSWIVGCPASDDSIHCAGTSGMIGFRLVFSRCYRGGVKSQSSPAQSNQTKPNEPPMSLSWVVAGVPVVGNRASGQQGRKGR